MIISPWLGLKRIVWEKRAAREGNVDIKVKIGSIFRFALHRIVTADGKELKHNGSVMSVTAVDSSYLPALRWTLYTAFMVY